LRGSLIISVLLHAALIGAALIGFASHQPPMSAPPPVSVNVVTPSGATALKAGRTDAQPDEAARKAAPAEKIPELVSSAAKLPPSEKLSEKAAALPPPKPKAPLPQESATKPERQEPERSAEGPAEKAPPTPPLPVPAEQAKPKRRDTPREQVRPSREEKPKPREAAPKPKPQQQDKIAEQIDKPTPPAQGKSNFDPDRIAALLNRDPTAGGAPVYEEPREPWRRPSTLEEQASGASLEQSERFARGAPEGRDDRMSANEIDAFRAQISRCWTPPVGGLGGDPIIVKLRIALNENGSLIRPPEVSNQLGSPFFRPAADSAVRAVMQCQPYRMPPEKYGQWRDMLLTFDPRHMYGG
jgi:hypothetical protein